MLTNHWKKHQLTAWLQFTLGFSNCLLKIDSFLLFLDIYYGSERIFTRLFLEEQQILINILGVKLLTHFCTLDCFIGVQQFSHYTKMVQLTKSESKFTLTSTGSAPRVPRVLECLIMGWGVGGVIRSILHAYQIFGIR